MHNLSNTYYQNEYESATQSENNFELAPEFESFESEYELQPEYEYENNEAEYEVLAQELQEISSEAEFESWLGKVLKKGAGLASRFIKSPIGQQATAALGNIAQKTLPGLASKAGGWLGGKIGGIVGQGDYGRQLGQQLGSRAAQAGLDRYPAFVKMAADAMNNLSNEFEMGATPAAVKPAIIKAAAKHYPIILKVKGTVDGRPVKGNIRSSISSESEYENEMFGESRDGEIMNNEATFNEVTELELASELLAVQSEDELDQFLGKLFKKAVGSVSKFAKSSTGKMLGGVLKGIAKKALPVAGAALGSFVPGVGTAIGGALGSAASNLFELELEGLSAEDREFETARAYVRFAGNAARRASRIRNTPPTRAARSAVMTAAKRYAPGLLARPNTTTNNYVTSNFDANGNGSEEGTWYRDGSRIILEGA